MKQAFSMIELIFVIVILGILAAVAIPKLSATRADAALAALSEDISNIQKSVAAYAFSQNKVSIKDAVQLSGWIDAKEAYQSGSVPFEPDETISKLGVFKSILAGEVNVTVDVSSVSMSDNPILRIDIDSLEGHQSTINRIFDINSSFGEASSLSGATVHTYTGATDTNATAGDYELSVELQGRSVVW